jgi:hypothetical protein
MESFCKVRLLPWKLTFSSICSRCWTCLRMGHPARGTREVVAEDSLGGQDFQSPNPQLCTLGVQTHNLNHNLITPIPTRVFKPLPRKMWRTTWFHEPRGQQPHPQQ